MTATVEIDLSQVINGPVEMISVDEIHTHPANPRQGDVGALVELIRSNGFYGHCIVQRSTASILVGNHRYMAAVKVGMRHVPVLWVDVDDEHALRILLSDNRSSDLADYNTALLAELLKARPTLDGTGYDQTALDALLDELAESSAAAHGSGEDQEEEIPEVPENPVTKPGDIWLIGKHRLICGDCRDGKTLTALFEGAMANVVITSPPYASQRAYDPSSGFKPIKSEEYVPWFAPVAAGIKSVIAADGSYFLNIKAHANEGERNLYVMDLVLAHRRQWGWRFVDEFCWRKTNDGVPGVWPDRFKNAWEPVFHFARQREIKFRPEAAGHASDRCLDYSPDTPKAVSGSGLLGVWDEKNRGTRGIARPSNVIEVPSEAGQGTHSAPFPRALVEFFLKAFSDPGDMAFDPFMGSGTTMAAAALLDRTAYGCEISPAYCDVIVQRMMNATGKVATLATTGETFAAVKVARHAEPATPPRVSVAV